MAFVFDNFAFIPEADITFGQNDIDKFATWFEAVQDDMSFAEFACRAEESGLGINRFIPFGHTMAAFGTPPHTSVSGPTARQFILNYAAASRSNIGIDRNYGSACGGTNPEGYWKCRVAPGEVWQEDYFKSCGQYPPGYTPGSNSGGGNGLVGGIVDSLSPDAEKPFYQQPLVWLLLLIALIVALRFIFK